MNFGGEAITKIHLLLTATCALASGAALANDSPDAAPYTGEEVEYRLSKAEYEDLKSYLDRAKQRLEITRAEAKSLAGVARYDRIALGIRETLELTASRDELFLFRYVLNRASELAALFVQNSDDQSKGKAFAASIVLLPLFELAIEYYKADDTARLSEVRIQSPNWVKFAADQIPELLRIATLAPSAKVRAQVIERALGWTARSLNSAPDRRAHAERVLSLVERLEGFRRNPKSLPKAQNALLKVYEEISSAQESQAKFPESNYPAGKAKAPRKDEQEEGFLPLIDVDMGGPIFHKSTTNYYHKRDIENDPPCFGNACDSEDRENWRRYRATIEVGTGAIFENTRDNLRPVAINADVDARLFGVQKASGSDANEAIYEVSSHMRLMIAPNAQGTPIYNVRMDAGAAAIPGGFPLPLGIWIVFEKNGYDAFSERILGFGANFALTFNVGEKGYVAIRYSPATMSTRFQAENESQALPGTPLGDVLGFFKRHSADFGDSHHNFSFMLKLAKFFLVIDANYGRWSHYIKPTVEHPSDEETAERINAYGAITIPLGVIFKNDAIKFETNYVNYRIERDNNRQIEGKRIGATYELEW